MVGVFALSLLAMITSLLVSVYETSLSNKPLLIELHDATILITRLTNQQAYAKMYTSYKNTKVNQKNASD